MLSSIFRLRTTWFAALIGFMTLVTSLAQDAESVTVPDVYARADRTVELNGTLSGSLNNLKELKARLKQTFTRNEELRKSTTMPESSSHLCYVTPVIIRADESLDYGAFADLIVEIRMAGADPIKIQASGKSNPYVLFVPQEPCPNQDLSFLKPNPLTLAVAIDSLGKLRLNGESIGTIADTSALSRKLSELFQRRAKQGAYRIGTNEVEKTLFVKGSRSLSVGDVMKVVDVVTKAGTDPTGLQIDDLER